MAINEPHMTCEEIVYGLRYDSEYGQFKEEIEVKSEKYWKSRHDLFAMQTAENKLIIGKKLITVFNEEIIENIPWSKVKVQLVAECSENVKVEVRIELGGGDDRRLRVTCVRTAADTWRGLWSTWCSALRAQETRHLSCWWGSMRTPSGPA